MKLIIIISFIVSISACGTLKYMNIAPPDPEDRWVKAGVGKALRKLELSECTGEESWSVDLQSIIDACMLEKGFVFIDHPFEIQHHARCEYAPYQHLPSCQSLKTRTCVMEEYKNIPACKVLRGGWSW